MKLYVLSDLHLEFAEFDPEPAALEACDVVVLAGDIAHGTEALAWASASCGTKPVIYVAGNHEFYGQDWSELLQQLRAQAADLGIHFLEDDEVQVQGVRFLGGSLWTNFEYFPERPRAVAMRRSAMGFERLPGNPSSGAEACGGWGPDWRIGATAAGAHLGEACCQSSVARTTPAREGVQSNCGRHSPCTQRIVSASRVSGR